MALDAVDPEADEAVAEPLSHIMPLAPRRGGDRVASGNAGMDASEGTRERKVRLAPPEPARLTPTPASLPTDERILSVRGRADIFEVARARGAARAREAERRRRRRAFIVEASSGGAGRVNSLDRGSNCVGDEESIEGIEDTSREEEKNLSQSRNGGRSILKDGGRGVGGIAVEEPFEKESDDEDIEGEFVDSSAAPRGMRQYTKLEVMSSNEIRGVLQFFHCFVFAAIAVTFAQLVAAHTAHRFQAPFAFRFPTPGLFTDELFDKGVAIEANIRREQMQDPLFADLAGALAGLGDDNMPDEDAIPELDDVVVRELNLLEPTSRSVVGISADEFLAARGLFRCSRYVVCDACDSLPASLVKVMDAEVAFAPGWLYDEELPTNLGTVQCGEIGLETGNGSATLALLGLGFESLEEEVDFWPDGGPPDGMTAEQVALATARCELERAQGSKCCWRTLIDNAAPVISDSCPGQSEPPPSTPSADASDQEWNAYKANLTQWLRDNGRGPNSDTPASYMALTTINSNHDYLITINGIKLTMSLISGALAAIYIVRLVRLGRAQITHEQIWVVPLLVMAAFYWSFIDSIESVDRIAMASSSEGSNSFLPGWFSHLANVANALREPAFTGIIFFYLWCNLHTYRILDPTSHLPISTFYLPKLAIIVPFIIFKSLSRPALGLVLSEIPLLSMVVWARSFHMFCVWKALRAELLYSIVAAIMELALIGIIVAEAATTTRALRRAKYLKYRTKQIGFRFFAYMSLTFFAVSSLLHLVIVLSIPNGFFHLPLVSETKSLVWMKENAEWLLGPSILLFGFVVTEAYVKLPKEALGVIKGWFKNSEIGLSSSVWSRGSFGSRSSDRPESDENDSRELLEPYSPSHGDDEGYGYRRPENLYETLPRSSEDRTSLAAASETSTVENGVLVPRRRRISWPKSRGDLDEELNTQIVEPVRYLKSESGDKLRIQANTFTMETHVMMFNFAWYVYYYGTPKSKKVNPVDSGRFTVHAHVCKETTDTHALVLDCKDRIVVAFRGTTSMRNMQTSIKFHHDSLRSVVPTSVDGEEEGERMDRLFGRHYDNAKVHKGFATAYRSIAPDVLHAVRELLLKKKRPVFLTGHSLGGALATLCSMDVWIKLGLSRREIVVSTFGSPRVGNEAFRQVYKSMIPMHWRIVVIPDMITKLPKVGYKHVGKKVTLTPYGRMLIDPNVLEQLHWSSNSAGFAYHRKASYMLAMRAWCLRNHGKSYVPGFWPFPVHADDRRRFESAMSMPAADSVTSGELAMQPTSRIIELDAMVDALGMGSREGDEKLSSYNALELWARFARRSLLSEALLGG